MDLKEMRPRLKSELGISEVNSGVYSNDWIDNPKGRKINLYSPIDGEFIAGVNGGSKEEYEVMVKNMEENYEKWIKLTSPQRGELIRLIGLELRKNKEKLGRIVSLETGKTVVEGEGEIQEMIDIADFAVGLSRQLYGYEIASERYNHRMYEQWLPLGIVGVITSFNFPSSVWSWNSFIAAVVGNVVVWKPSSKAPLTAISVMNIITRVIKEHHYPEIFSLIAGGGGEVGNLMTSDNRIKLISFTGSVDGGRKVSEAVAKRFGKVILELGGNNASIISDRADINVALKGVAFGALATAGQRCTTTRRIIVQESIYDEFIKKLVNVYSKVKIGNPLEEGVLVGPLIDESAVNNFMKAIEQARHEGGRVLFGGEKLSIKGYEKGFYVKPAIITMPEVSPVSCQETFAPILYVFKYKTIHDAIKIHNAVPQGLSSSIFTTDLREEELFLSPWGSDCGLANVNTATAGAEIGGAFGGEKETGGGRESGSDAWKSYARRQTVTINWGRDIPLSQGIKFDIK
ncbi:MAG: aldehyde dehydrogenase family protein [Candidatus Thermoplasmatota archaeon]|nr:aldehyde dehydrogenase family protein [Candidatus Thermoplasmatota archaeon]MCL5963492.1 aldehyde dehydrogenase family protein [Candidatus Thermoplasmatota archaeon]